MAVARNEVNHPQQKQQQSDYDNDCQKQICFARVCFLRLGFARHASPM
jgi:hypothetical protein